MLANIQWLRMVERDIPLLSLKSSSRRKLALCPVTDLFESAWASH